MPGLDHVQQQQRKQRSRGGHVAGLGQDQQHSARVTVHNGAREQAEHQVRRHPGSEHCPQAEKPSR